MNWANYFFPSNIEKKPPFQKQVQIFFVFWGGLFFFIYNVSSYPQVREEVKILTLLAMGVAKGTEDLAAKRFF